MRVVFRRATSSAGVGHMAPAPPRFPSPVVPPSTTPLMLPMPDPSPLGRPRVPPLPVSADAEDPTGKAGTPVASAGSTDTKSPVESGRPDSFFGVEMAFFLCGIVNSEMPPKCRPFFSSSRPFSPSSAFLAASSTLNEISFDVPTV